ncbi:xylulokinase [Solwaraspora sp. WMMD792]|uniref:xylulokinase n=1 Tax=Solwaraspora sp. WMMD792 TaxID=3016099 RepID=UPI00241738FF|nr:xylulokinase [Solwaraspora sp. WMMD792]MDG4771573.1 xylulokinase [Solwaraspora sp. WMMD792]
MPVVAGVDSSTQSCTVELRDAVDGTLLGSGRAPHPPTFPPVSEQPATTWWSAFTTALPAAIADAATRGTAVTPQSIGAISVAGQCHGLVMLDAAGQVLRDVKLWNDTTSAPQAAALVTELGAAGWAEAVGSVPTAAFTITKLAWVAEHEPQLLRRLATVLLPHDYLTYRLTGRTVTDRSEATGTGYYAAHEQRWRTDLLTRFVDADLDWATMLPTVLGPAEPAGTLIPDVARQLGLRPDVVVGPGAGDQHAGALGLGIRSGEVVYSLGTSGVVLTTTDDPVHDASGWVNGVADAAGGYLPLVSVLNCAKVTDTFARLLGVDHDELARLALAAPANPDRPVLAAFLDGERSPDRPRARGVLAGLTTATTREELASAAVEGVLLALVRGHERLRVAGAPADGDVLVTGGAARSAAYRQLLADLLRTPVRTCDAPEATARGACLQASAVLAGADIRQVRDAWRPATLTVTEPRTPARPDVSERYARLADWDGLDSPADPPISLSTEDFV